VVRNHGREAVSLPLVIDLAADFRDLFDIRGFPRARRGDWFPPEVGPRDARLRYRAVDGVMVGTAIEFDRDPAIFAASGAPEDPAPFAPTIPAADRDGATEATTRMPGVRASFSLRLPPGDEWRLTVAVQPQPAAGPVSVASAPPDDRHAVVTTSDRDFTAVLRRCALDLDELQTSFPDGSLPAAGIPWFVAPFGRDSLINGLQTFHFAPRRAAGTLLVLAALQGDKVDHAKEEEPGKILHEMRYGEMARVGEIPHTPYYGTVDATPLFAWLAAEVAGWTGDRALYETLKPHLDRAFAWMETFGDPDGDGLIEYRTDIPGVARITNQVWKDSFDSLNHLDGRQALGPVAAVEVQGYAFAAYRRVADVAEAFGERDYALRLRAKAELLRAAVEERFWMEEFGFYAQALDGDKRQVQAASSNPGHLLLCGLPSPERAARTIARFGRPDFASGWGVRTLSADAATYNPMSYHNGSVWPHDTSLVGAGCFAYGDAGAGNAIMACLFAAARTQPLQRLPELCCGFARLDGPDDVPVPYPVSCSPQAWAAGALPLLVRSMLGLRARPGEGTLEVRPALPEWLDEVSIADLDVLGQRGSLRVSRTANGYDVDAPGIRLAES
ncbi:MAG: MGH1-like glycoside hydrolase domain-containing protein, partial [Thermomicrobiales bacterium]